MKLIISSSKSHYFANENCDLRSVEVKTSRTPLFFFFFLINANL